MAYKVWYAIKPNQNKRMPDATAMREKKDTFENVIADWFYIYIYMREREIYHQKKKNC